MDTNETDGFQNEINFANALNGKKVKTLLPNFQDMLFQLYGYIDYNAYVFCHVDHTKRKYDIIITIDHQVKRVSIKKGNYKIYFKRYKFRY